MNSQDVTIKDEPPHESDSDTSSSSFFEDTANTSWWLDDGIELPDLDGKKSSNSVSDISYLTDFDDDLPDIVSDLHTFDGGSTNHSTQNVDNGDIVDREILAGDWTNLDIAKHCSGKSRQETDSRHVQPKRKITADKCLSSADTRKLAQQLQENGQAGDIQQTEEQQYDCSTSSGERDREINITAVGSRMKTSKEGHGQQENEREIIPAFSSHSARDNGSHGNSSSPMHWSCAADDGSAINHEIQHSTNRNSPSDVNSRCNNRRDKGNAVSDITGHVENISVTDNVGDSCGADSSFCWYQVVNREVFFTETLASQATQRDFNIEPRHVENQDSISTSGTVGSIDYSAFCIATDYIIIQPETTVDAENIHQVDNIVSGITELSVTETTLYGNLRERDISTSSQVTVSSPDGVTGEICSIVRKREGQNCVHDGIKSTPEISKSMELSREGGKLKEESACEVSSTLHGGSNSHVEQPDVNSNAIIRGACTMNIQETPEDQHMHQQQYKVCAEPSTDMVPRSDRQQNGEGMSVSDQIPSEPSNVTHATALCAARKDKSQVVETAQVSNTCRFSVSIVKHAPAGNTVSFTVDGGKGTVEPEKQSDTRLKNTSRGDISKDSNTSTSDVNTSFESEKSSTKENPCVYKLLGSLTRNSNHENVSINTAASSAEMSGKDSKQLGRKKSMKHIRNLLNDFCYSDISEAEDNQGGNLEYERSSAELTNVSCCSFVKSSVQNISAQTIVQNKPCHFSDISDEETVDLGPRQNSAVIQQGFLDKSRLNMCTSLETEFHFSDISEDELPAYGNVSGSVDIAYNRPCSGDHLESLPVTESTHIKVNQPENVHLQNYFRNRNNNASQHQAKRISKKYRLKRHEKSSKTSKCVKSGHQATLGDYYSDITEDSSATFSDIDKKEENCPRTLGVLSSDSEMSSVEHYRSQVMEYSDEEREEEVGQGDILPKASLPNSRDRPRKQPPRPGHRMASFIVSDSESDVESSDCEADSESEDEKEDLSEVEEADHVFAKPMEKNGFLNKIKDRVGVFPSYSSVVANATYNTEILNRVKVASKCDDADSGISDNSTTRSCELSTHGIELADSRSDKTNDNNDSFLQDHSKCPHLMNVPPCKPHITEIGQGDHSTYFNNQVIKSIRETPVTSSKTVSIVSGETEYRSPTDIVVKEASHQTCAASTKDDPSPISEHNKIQGANGDVKDIKNEMVVSELPVSKSVEQLCSFPSGVLVSPQKKVLVSLVSHNDVQCKRITLLSTARHIEFLTLESTGDEKDVSSSDSTVNSDNLSGDTESDDATLQEETAQSDLTDSGGSSVVDDCTDTEASINSDSYGKQGTKKVMLRSSYDQGTASERKRNSSKLQLNAVVKVRKLSENTMTRIASMGNKECDKREVGKTLKHNETHCLLAAEIKKDCGEDRYRNGQGDKTSLPVIAYHVRKSQPDQRKEQHRKSKPTSDANLPPKKKKPTKSKTLKTFECVECSKSYNTKADLYRHFSRAHEGINVNKPHKCPVCGRCFKIKYHLNRHLAVHTGETPFECVLCGKGFKRRSHLESHELGHTGLKIYRCELCIKTFAHRQSYQNHLAAHKGEKRQKCGLCHKEVNCMKRHIMTHTGELPYGCDMCEKRFATREELKRHSVKHSTRRRFECKQCHEKFKTRQCLRMHMRSHSGESPYICDICDRSFRHQNYLKIHLRAHTGEKPYVCSQCGRCFSQRAHLKTHFLVHLMVKDHLCGKCGKTFTRKSYLLEHQRTHSGEKPFGCGTCGQTFRNSSDVKAHDLVHHQGLPGVKQVPCQLCNKFVSDMKRHMQGHRKEKPFTCKLCSKQLADKATLRKHMMIHTGEKPFQCPECGKCFRFTDVLKKHLLIHSNEKPYSCTECDYSCRDSSTLLTHSRKHSGLLPFVCKYSGCDKRFSTSSSRKSHHQRHANKREYVCNQCGKSFNNASTLRTHLKLHSGIKPYPCHLCDQAFRQSTHLKHHLLIHSGEYPFPCDKCDKKFRTSSELKAHKTIHSTEKLFSCTLCPTKFSSRKAQHRHNKRKHEKSNKTESVPTRETIRFHCQECSYSNFKKSALLIHVKEVHRGEKVKKTIGCTVSGCSVKFRYQSELKQHLSTTHSEERSFICKLCQKSFKDHSGLKIHMVIHRNVLPFKCPQCDKRFSQMSNMRTHLVTHSDVKNFECHICGLRFKLKYSMKDHIKNVHQSRELIECPKCDKTYKSKDAFTKHMRQHEGIVEARLPCPFCSKTYARKDCLTYHLKTHTGERPFVCNECGAAFASSTTLKIHSRTHTGEKPFPCTECGKRFAQKAHVRIHIKGFHQGLKVHKSTSKKPKTCELCGKVFTRKNGLDYHMRSHNNEKPYACSYCDMTFRGASGLKSHERTHTGETPYQCNHCDKRFSRTDMRNEHVRKHTGELLTCKSCPQLFKTYAIRSKHKCGPVSEEKDEVEEDSSD